MRVSRRQLGFILPALAAAAAAPKTAKAQARAQVPTTAPTPATPAAPRQKMLESKLYHHKAVPYTGNDTKKARRFFMGDTHTGFGLEMHETILSAGTETHAPHKHVHEEIIIIVEGTVESYVEGKTEVLEPGSVMWYASNQMHSARNVGKTPSRYYVIELRGDDF